MAAALVPDILWEVIEPLVPCRNPSSKGDVPVYPSVRQWHRVCPSQWHTLGDVAEGTGLWLGHDLLEAPARLARVWYLAIDSP
jgi:hypothetical protein